MSSSFTSLPNSAKVALATVATISLATVSYALVFDYRRRNDPVFRKKLLKEQRKIEKVGRQQHASGQQELINTLKRALAVLNSEPGPNGVEEKEQYFMEQVAIGEQLAVRGPEFHVASAISFYKALKVYPAPHELAIIYQKTQPASVFALVMELIALDNNMSASERSSDPRDNTSNALLTEIEPDAAPAPAAAPVAAPESENGSSPSSKGSYIHVEAEMNLETGESIVVEETIVVVAEEAVVKDEEQVKEAADPVEATL